MHEPFYKLGHVFPHRILLKQGNEFRRMVDIQIVDEKHGMSVYAKPPSEYVYESVKPSTKLSLPPTGTLEIPVSNDVTKGITYFNPYLSWHGSGHLHANGYSTRDLSKDDLLADSGAIALSELGVSPDILFTLVLPVSMLSHGKTTPPPDNFTGNYLEISNNPSRAATLDRNGPLHLVLDQSALKPGALVLDVMIHDRGVDMNIRTNHPYPAGAEICYVADPVKITAANLDLPAVTLFFYQPTGKTEVLITKQPSIFWGRSKGAKSDQLFQVSLLG